MTGTGAFQKAPFILILLPICVEVFRKSNLETDEDNATRIQMKTQTDCGAVCVTCASDRGTEHDMILRIQREHSSEKEALEWTFFLVKTYLGGVPNLDQLGQEVAQQLVELGADHLFSEAGEVAEDLNVAETCPRTWVIAPDIGSNLSAAGITQFSPIPFRSRGYKEYGSNGAQSPPVGMDVVFDPEYTEYHEGPLAPRAQALYLHAALLRRSFSEMLKKEMERDSGKSWAQQQWITLRREWATMYTPVPKSVLQLIHTSKWLCRRPGFHGIRYVNNPKIGTRLNRAGGPQELAFAEGQWTQKYQYHYNGQMAHNGGAYIHDLYNECLSQMPAYEELVTSGEADSRYGDDADQGMQQFGGRDASPPSQRQAEYQRQSGRMPAQEREAAEATRTRQRGERDHAALRQRPA